MGLYRIISGIGSRTNEAGHQESSGLKSHGKR